MKRGRVQGWMYGTKWAFVTNVVALVASLALLYMVVVKTECVKDDVKRREAICRANNGQWEVNGSTGACVDPVVLE